MIVRIGVSDTVKEIEVEMAGDTAADDLKATIEAGVAQAEGLFWLTDKDGRQVGVPAAKVAYIDIGAPNVSGKIGFGA